MDASNQNSRHTQGLLLNADAPLTFRWLEGNHFREFPDALEIEIRKFMAANKSYPTCARRERVKLGGGGNYYLAPSTDSSGDEGLLQASVFKAQGRHYVVLQDYGSGKLNGGQAALLGLFCSPKVLDLYDRADGPRSPITAFPTAARRIQQTQNLQYSNLEVQQTEVARSDDAATSVSRDKGSQGKVRAGQGRRVRSWSLENNKGSGNEAAESTANKRIKLRALPAQASLESSPQSITQPKLTTSNDADGQKDGVPDTSNLSWRNLSGRTTSLPRRQTYHPAPGTLGSLPDTTISTTPIHGFGAQLTDSTSTNLLHKFVFSTRTSNGNVRKKPVKICTDVQLLFAQAQISGINTILLSLQRASRDAVLIAQKDQEDLDMFLRELERDAKSVEEITVTGLALNEA